MEQQREGQGTTGGQGSTPSSGSATSGTGTTGSFADTAGAGTRTGFSGTDDGGARAGSYDRKFVNEEQGLKERVGEKLAEGKERVGEAAHSRKNRLADQLERVGDRIEERARNMEQTGGVQGKAGHVALRASETLDRSADYIRTHEVDEMRDDVEHAIRQRPLLSIGIAAGIGFLLARLLRD
jgi:ElaB/YqjD/DUF883 family membrane-anchored ribosome-binding protein